MVAPWICSTALRTRAWLVAARLARAKTSCSEGWVSNSRPEGAALIARHLSQAREIAGGRGRLWEVAVHHGRSREVAVHHERSWDVTGDRGRSRWRDETVRNTRA